MTERRSGLDAWGLLAIPASGLLLVFFGYPLFDIIKTSVTDFIPPQAGGLDNYDWFFSTSVNVKILFRTIGTAGLVTVLCCLIGYPFALLLTAVSKRGRILLLSLVFVSFFTSVVVRNYSWFVLLQKNGPVNSVLESIGFGKVDLLGTVGGVTIAEVQLALPFLILPLYARLLGIDPRLREAAESLGAPAWKAFLKVYLPLSAPGLGAGALLVFTLSLGFYLTPAIVGSPEQQLLSPLIVDQVSQLLALGRGGAMAVVLLVVTLVLISITAVLLRRVLSRAGATTVVDAQHRPRTKAGRRVLYTLGALVAALLIVPTLVVIPLGFTADQSFTFPPTGWSTRWYSVLFSDPVWYQAMLTSLKVGVVSTVLATVLGTAAAFAVVRSRIPGTSVISAFLISPLIVPLVVSAIAIYGVFLRWDLAGELPGIILAHTVLILPLVMIPVIAALASLDTRLETAALSLGASPARVFRRVTLPLILPSVVTGAVFAFVSSLDETVVSLLIVGTENRTLPVEMFISVTREIDPTVAAASSLFLLATTVIVGGLAMVQVRRLSSAPQQPVPAES